MVTLIIAAVIGTATLAVIGLVVYLSALDAKDEAEDLRKADRHRKKRE